MARPTGRPPSSIRANHHSHSNSRDRDSTVAASLRTPGNSSPESLSRDEMHTVAADLEASMSLDNFLDNIDTWNAEFNLEDDAMGGHDAGLPPPPQVAASQTSSSPTIVALPSHLDTIHSHNTDPLDLHKPSSLSSYATPPGYTELGLAVHTENYELMLSKLYSALAAQFCTISASPWDVQGTLQLSFSHRGSAAAELHSCESHPLAQVSRLSAEFEKLLCGLQPRTTTPFAFQLQTGPRLRTTQLLVVLSCYLQIVAIYDVIFTKVFEYLLQNSETGGGGGGCSVQLGAPIMYLGGLPVAPNHPLSSSLLVHLTEHQLHKLEQLIGLPEFYRVSSRSADIKRDEDMGLFGCQRSKSLFHAVIQLGEDRHDNYDDTRCVRSLKRTMRQIKDF